jgi:hypothetical protein
MLFSFLLGVIAKSRKVTISFVIPVCLQRTRLQLDGFSWSLIFEYFQKIVKKFNFSKNMTWTMAIIRKDLCAFMTWTMAIIRKDLCAFMITHRLIFRRLRKASDKWYRENQHTHFIFNYVSRQSFPLWHYLLLFFSGSAAQRGFWHPPFTRFFDHTQWRSTVGRTLWTSDQLVAETSTWQHTTHTTNINELGGIRTHDRSRRTAVGQRLRPRGQWDRPLYEIMWSNIVQPDRFKITR